MADQQQQTSGSAEAGTPALMRYGAWTRYEPEEIKQAVPLQWAVGKFFGVWDAGAEMVSCPFPAHEDDTPSFNLWDPDESGFPQRYGCFGCGESGDVITLIMYARNVGFSEACRIAVDELAPEIAASTWTPTETVSKRRRKSATELERVVDSYKPITMQGFDAFIQFMRRKGLGGEAVERYALEEWEWGGLMEMGPTVYIPHRTHEGKLTGIKYRATRSDSRWNEDGSSFTNLYGAWRDKGRPNVFIAEGETDTIRAAYDLRDEPYDVFGLPSGANQRPTAEMIEQLQGRTVFICGDGDKAGRSANRMWFERDPLNTYVVRMPEGEDIVSCGISAKELLRERVHQPRHQPSKVRAVGSVYLRDMGKDTKGQDKDPKVISDFVFVPTRQLLMEDGSAAWEGKLTGRATPVVLRARDFNTVRNMTEWANKYESHGYTGSQIDTQLLLNYIAAEADYLPLEKATTKAGKVGRSFVGPDELCIGPDHLRYIPPSRGDAGLKGKIKINEGPWETRAILALEALNDPGTMAVILGWLVASLLRGQRAPAPPLFISGESGSGKTHLVSSVLNSFGFHVDTNLTTTTPFGVDSLVASSIGFPVWFDEYRSGARDDSMGRLRQILRDAYNGQSSMKGGMTQQATELTEVTTWAGIVVSGEMGTSETSLRDRLVYITLDPNKRQAAPYRYLHDDPYRTYGLGHALLSYLVKRPAALFKVLPMGTADDPDRFRDTMGYVQAGWDAWLGFRASVGLEDTPVGPNFTAMSEERAEQPDPYIDALRHCEGKQLPGGDYIVQGTSEGLKIIPNEVIKEAKTADIILPGGSKELIAWLRRRHPGLKDTRIGSRRGKLIPDWNLDAVE